VTRAQAIALVALAACGRIRFDPRSDAAVDAPPDGCALSPWSTPVQLTEIATVKGDSGPELALDGLTLYFDSPRVNVGDLYVAVRPDRASPFGIATNLGAVNTTNRELDPTITADQLDLLFSSDRVGGAYCIYESLRASPAAAFPAATRRGELCTTTQAEGPSISADGLTLYYSTHGSTSKLGAIMVAIRSARNAAFGAPSPVAVASAALVGFPALSSDQLTLYLEEEPTTYDILTAVRPDPASAFGTPTPLSIDTDTANEADPAISGDNLELFFDSNRAGTVGATGIYHATRTCQ
jgi:hypothetical protein